MPDEGDVQETQENQGGTCMSMRRLDEDDDEFPLVGSTMEEAISLARGRLEETQTELAIILERHQRGRKAPTYRAIVDVGHLITLTAPTHGNISHEEATLTWLQIGDVVKVREMEEYTFRECKSS